MSDEIVVTRDVLKAIGADTRIEILKALEQRQKTQSELATELKLSAPTVLEHLDHLASAGLVEKMEEGRKWKYYKLTETGKKIISKTPVNVVMLLGISLMFVLAAFLLIIQKTAFLVPQASSAMTTSEQNVQMEKAIAIHPTPSSGQEALSAAAPSMADLNKSENLENKTTLQANRNDANPIPKVENQNILPEFVVFSIAVFMVGFSIGYLTRKV